VGGGGACGAGGEAAPGPAPRVALELVLAHFRSGRSAARAIADLEARGVAVAEVDVAAAGEAELLVRIGVAPADAYRAAAESTPVVVAVAVADDRLGPDDNQVAPPGASQPPRQHPAQPVARAQSRAPRRGEGQHRRLVARQRVLGDEVAPVADGASERGQHEPRVPGHDRSMPEGAPDRVQSGARPDCGPRSAGDLPPRPRARIAAPYTLNGSGVYRCGFARRNLQSRSTRPETTSAVRVRPDAPVDGIIRRGRRTRGAGRRSSARSASGAARRARARRRPRWRCRS
jgi:hypothetical protein